MGGGGGDGGVGAGEGDGGVGAGAGGGVSGPPHASRGVAANKTAKVIKHTLINIFSIYLLFFKAPDTKRSILYSYNFVNAVFVYLDVRVSLTSGKQQVTSSYASQNYG